MSEQSKKPALVINPEADVALVIRDIVGHMGEVEDTSASGYRIKVHHGGSFRWDELFKALLYRDFKVSITRQKADLYIEAAA